MKPCSKNFCGGNYQDWLEVNLTNACNAKCAWCIDRKGFHPTKHATWQEIAQAAINSGKKNIILLGGEPTLFKDLKFLVKALKDKDLNVYITTNGSRLTPEFIAENCVGVKGINISIHHYFLFHNKKITGLDINIVNLIKSIKVAKMLEMSVRLNCNLIKGSIDSEKEIDYYIEWAKWIGATSVRFAELKEDENNFVDLHKIFGNKHGLNSNPFLYGCNSETVINGMPVNFRQMCGLNITLRPKVENVVDVAPKQVLYYDGKIYNGWQSGQKNIMNTKEILNAVKNGTMTIEEAAKLLEKKKKVVQESFCQY